SKYSNPKKEVLNLLANRRKKLNKTTNLAKYFTTLRKNIRNLTNLWKHKISCTEYENINETLKEINVTLNTNLQNIEKKVTIRKLEDLKGWLKIINRKHEEEIEIAKIVELKSEWKEIYRAKENIKEEWFEQ
ncbi:46318_t:CDS:2, partial [Gigaspora margarita]